MNRVVFLIFLIAILIRFLHFPENVYFGFDQARDAFESQNIYKNLDLKIIGPSTATENLFHGPLYWYLIGPFYLLGLGNPIFPAAFLLFVNALGVFLIFWLARLLFGKEVGVIAACVFAFSFEQTQYALYFGNPAPAVLTTLVFWGGLMLAIFKKRWEGIPLAVVGLGLSIQFEFFLIYLSVIFVIVFLLFRKTFILLLNAKRILLTILAFIFSIINFVAAEVMFNFRTTKTLLATITRRGGGENILTLVSAYKDQFTRHIHDNLFSFGEMAILIFIIGISIVIIARREKISDKILFLLLWIFSGILVYAFGIPKLYYFGIGISGGLIILASYFIFLVYSKIRVLGLLVIGIILASNVLLIKNQNYKGVINDIYVQEGMLLSREIKLLDFIYQKADGRPIVVSALTMPLKINTTWSYLFSWYGKKKYGYLPYWAGEAAPGYPGELPRWESQDEDYAAFSIIEPVRGVRQAFVDQFLDTQSQYGQVLEERVFGDKQQAQLIVQRRGKSQHD